MSTTSNAKRDDMKLQSKHRVTFSSDIEEYDDEEAVITVDEMENSSHENEGDIEEIDDVFEQEGGDLSQERDVDVMREDSSDNETIIARHGSENSEQSSDGEPEDVVVEEKTTNVKVEKTIEKESPKSPISPNRTSDSKICAQQHQLLKIHLNVRKCCEFRYLENDRLPRYNGYISQYGLSKDQLDELENHRRIHRQKMNEKRKQYREALAQKSAENERAFAKWLYHKQKTTKSHTKNMYDAKQ